MDGMQGTSILSWMAWTAPTALFFIFIACCLVAMTVWEILVPGGDPRHGILGLDTTRGDRLFISLLGSAFICLAYLAAFGSNLWPAVAICVLYAIAVFSLGLDAHMPLFGKLPARTSSSVSM